MSNIARSNANASGPRPTYVNSLNDKTMVKELQPPFGTMSTNPNNHKQISTLARANNAFNKEQNAKMAEEREKEKKKLNASKAPGGGFLSFFGFSAPAAAAVAAPAPTGAAAPVASNSADSKGFFSVGGRRSRKNKSKKSSKKSKKSYKKSSKKSKKSKKAKSNRK